MAEFFSMGGYGAFVWPSFGMVTGVMAVLWVQSRIALKKREAELAALQSQMDRASARKPE